MKSIKFFAIITLLVLIINILAGVVYEVTASDDINEINETNDVGVEENGDVDEEDESTQTRETVDNMTNGTEETENDVIANEMTDQVGNDDIDDEKVDKVEKTEETEEKEEKEEIQEKEELLEENQIMMYSMDVTEPSVKYRTHVQNVGWQNYVQNGATSGTLGKSLRLEALNIQVQGLDNVKIKYQVHIQNIGWQNWKTNGDMAGTSGQSLRLEAIRICLDTTEDYSIMYRVHVQNIGWQDWKYDGDMAGTSGQSLRLEAIQIKIVPKQKKGRLYLDTPSNGSTYYSPSSINVQGWKMANVSNTLVKAYIDNKEISSSAITYYNRKDVTDTIVAYGTATQNPNAGFKFAIDTSNVTNGSHTIKIVLYSGSTSLATLSSTFKIDRSLHVSYKSHVQNVGWQNCVMDGNTSGTQGKGLRVEAINISLINAPSNAKITYRAHVQNVGWQNWTSNGGVAGTSGKSLRVEALQIKLENMDDYTVEYQVHVQNIGWTGWYIDGETAGTVGRGLRIEAIRVRIVPNYKREYNGIDVSEFNGSINWGFVKRAGVDFAMIRIGYRGYGQAGNFAEDAKFRTNITAAKKAGVPVGIYFFTQAITEAEAYEEADWVINRLKEYNIDYPVAIDVEKLSNSGRTDGLTKNQRTLFAKIFCQRIQQAGYIPMVYTNIDGASNMLNMNDLQQFDTWIAHYKNNPTLKPSYDKSYAMWQYTSTGTVNGILGNVDLNICYKKY